MIGWRGLLAADSARSPLRFRSTTSRSRSCSIIFYHFRSPLHSIFSSLDPLSCSVYTGARPLCELGDWTHCSFPDFQRAQLSPSFSKTGMGGSNYIKFWGDIHPSCSHIFIIIIIIYSPRTQMQQWSMWETIKSDATRLKYSTNSRSFVLGVSYVVSFSELEPSKSKIRPNFDVFDPLPVKIREGWTICLSRKEDESSLLQWDVLRFLITCSVLKPQSVKGDWCRKSRHNFAFLTLWNLGEGRAKYLSAVYEFGLPSNIWYTSLSIVWEIWAWVSKKQGAEAKHIRPSAYRRCGLKLHMTRLDTGHLIQ